MPGETRIDRRVIGAISTLAIGVVGAVLTKSFESVPGWISTAFLILAGVGGAVWAVESYYRPRFAVPNSTDEPHAAAADPDEAASRRRSRLAKQQDVVLLVSVLAGGTLGMIIGIVVNGGAT